MKTDPDVEIGFVRLNGPVIRVQVRNPLRLPERRRLAVYLVVDDRLANDHPIHTTVHQVQAALLQINAYNLAVRQEQRQGHRQVSRPPREVNDAKCPRRVGRNTPNTLRNEGEDTPDEVRQLRLLPPRPLRAPHVPHRPPAAPNAAALRQGRGRVERPRRRPAVHDDRAVRAAGLEAPSLPPLPRPVDERLLLPGAELGGQAVEPRRELVQRAPADHVRRRRRAEHVTEDTLEFLELHSVCSGTRTHVRTFWFTSVCRLGTPRPGVWPWWAVAGVGVRQVKE
mmetsp:Transcript_16893/g.39251  ORF Transcript_16893/g.39251 Transcript_16893/m.39251 type:complete len:282 (+) Transcript_16893:812-1657(+)